MLCDLNLLLEFVEVLDSIPAVAGEVTKPSQDTHTHKHTHSLTPKGSFRVTN